MQEEARLKVEGLGEAAYISAQKLKGLSTLVGTPIRSFGFERLPQGKQAVGIGQSTTSAEKTQSYLQDKEFMKAFGKPIQSLKSATKAQAEQIFKSLIIELKGRGLADEVIQEMITAIQVASGKKNITLDLKKLNIATPENLAVIQSETQKLVDQYQQQFAKGISTITYAAHGYASTVTILSDELKKSLGILASSMTSQIGALGNALGDGAITSQQYADGIATISKQIAGMPSPAALELTTKIFETMDPTGVAGKAVAGIKSVSDRLLIMQAFALSSLGPDSELIKGLSSADSKLREISRQKIQNLITDTIASSAKAAAAELKKADAAFQDLNTTATQKTPQDAIKERIQGLTDQVDAYNKLSNH